MEKFTQGEWVVDDGGDVIVSGSNGGVGCPARDGTIASLNDGEYIENTNKHDAHLIAAAPEMYRMLESVLSEMHGLIDEVNDQWASRITSQTETEPDYHDMETLHNIQLLLKKARGE